MKILKMHSDIEIDYVAMFMSVTYQSGYTHKRYWIYNEYSNNIREYIEHDKKLPEGWAMCRLE
jgi:hypothetical protein